MAELRNSCSQRELDAKGKKIDLIKRLVASAEEDSPDESPAFRRRVREESEAEATFKTLSISELKDLCTQRNLDATGKKPDLIERLLASTGEDQKPRRREEVASKEKEQQPPGRKELKPEQYLTATDRFVQALERDELDETSLQEIFNVQMPQPGQIVKGTVSSLVEWGAFVELHESGWQGLIHVSEIADEFVDNIEDWIQPGEEVEALVIRTNAERLDRLSLSLRRLHSPAARIAYASGAGILAEKIDQDRQKIPAALERVLAAPPPVQRNSITNDTFKRLEMRVNAIEAVLIQLGHTKALRNAQNEMGDGTNRQQIAPSLETMLTGLPMPGQARKQPKKVDTERMAIDQILADLRGEASPEPLVNPFVKLDGDRIPEDEEDEEDEDELKPGFSTEEMDAMLSNTIVANVKATRRS